VTRFSASPQALGSRGTRPMATGDDP